MKRSGVAIPVCTSCFYGDDVTGGFDPLSGDWVFTCTRPSHGSDGYVWAVPAPVGTKSGASFEGFLEELGVYDDLLLCVKGELWLEYGVVENRYRELSPATYARLVKEFSHSARNAIRGGPDASPDRSPKVSSRLARALGVLADRGLISQWQGPATGYWGTYLSRVSYWAPTPAPSHDSVITWEKDATAVGMDADVWLLPGEGS